MRKTPEVLTGGLRMISPPFRMVSFSGGPRHGTVAPEEDFTQGLANYTVDPPTYYRRETPTSTRFVFKGAP